MMLNPTKVYDQKTKTAIGASNPFYLRQAKKAQPALYDGEELLKTHHVPVIVPSSEEDLELAEITRIKMHEKMNDSASVEKRVKIIPPNYSKENFMATFTPQTQLTPEQVFWSLDLEKRKPEELKVNTLPLPVLPPTTVYPPNTPVHLVPRTLPTTSQVNIESSRTSSREQDTSNRSGNDAHVDDADIRPIYDEEPMAEERESAIVKPHHMIAPSSSRYNLNDMVYNHYLEEAKKKIQESGKNSRPSVMPSARSQSIANDSKPKPRMNNQNLGIRLHLKVKCVFNANHDSCVTKFLNEVNSRAKVPSNKTTKRYIPVEQTSFAKKPERQIPKRHRSSIKKTSVVHEKTMTPRSCLRWKPTGKIFKTVGLRWVPTGKIFTSSTTKVDSEPQNGSNADITNQYECAQTLDVSAGLAPPRQMTSDHNSSELGIHDHSNELSSSKLVPKVVPLADKTATSRQELELLFHHHITMLSFDGCRLNNMANEHVPSPASIRSDDQILLFNAWVSIGKALIASADAPSSFTTTTETTSTLPPPPPPLQQSTVHRDIRKLVRMVFNSLVHSLRALSTLRRSGLKTASAAAKPCKAPCSHFKLITKDMMIAERPTTQLPQL
ncbi:hypothetical protein Tco_0616105 [Tanacetum coccineum]